VCVKGILRAGWFGVIIHSSDSGLAEEAVLVIHQVLIDTGPEIKKRVTFNHLKSAESCHMFIRAALHWNDVSNSNTNQQILQF